MAGKIKWSTDILKLFCGEEDVIALPSKIKLVARFSRNHRYCPSYTTLPWRWHPSIIPFDDERTV